MILGIDTSGPIGSVALMTSDGMLEERSITSERSHLEQLLPLVKDMLRAADVTAADIKGIAVGLGPGTFTGTRIGISTGRALAQTLAIPILGMASLDIIARQIPPQESVMAVAVDARRNEVYRAIYKQANTELDRISEYETRTAIQLIDECRILAPVCLTGNAISAYPELAAKTDIFFLAKQDLWMVKASVLCRLLSTRLYAGETSDLADLLPIYVRPSDAELGAANA